MNAGSRRPWIGGGLVLGALLSVPLAVFSARVVERETLTPTAAAPDGASGHALLVLGHGSKAKLVIRVRGLEARQAYDIVVDDEVVGSLTTNPSGSGHAIFRAGPGHKGGPKKRILDLTFDPRGATIVVRDADTGDDVLMGELAGDGGSPGGAFACCKPHEGEDDGALECDEETPEECLADGGTPSDATSCLPNPCGTTTSIVCCVPEGSATGGFVDDDDDAEQRACVEGTTPDQCAAQGGTVVNADSCDPNPCTMDHDGDDDGHDDCHDGSDGHGDGGDDDDQGDGSGGPDRGHGHGGHGGDDD
jgi:hypothetical protein